MLTTIRTTFSWLLQLPSYPRKLFFFCEEEAASGGETPILLSHILYERMKEKYPNFVGNIEELGLMYTRFLEGEDDTSSALGRGWKSMFGTSDKIVAQQRFVITKSVLFCLTLFSNLRYFHIFHGPLLIILNP